MITAAIYLTWYKHFNAWMTILNGDLRSKEVKHYLLQQEFKFEEHAHQDYKKRVK